MALYDPVDGVYRKVKAAYDPVDGVYRKVKAAYDPVDGVYRQYFGGIDGVILAAGDYTFGSGEEFDGTKAFEQPMRFIAHVYTNGENIDECEAFGVDDEGIFYFVQRGGTKFNLGGPYEDTYIFGRDCDITLESDQVVRQEVYDWLIDAGVIFY